MKILELKKDNEVFEIHHGTNGYFIVIGTTGLTTEMNLTAQDVVKIKNSFTKSKLPKKPKYKTVDVLKVKENNW